MHAQAPGLGGEPGDGVKAAGPTLQSTAPAMPATSGLPTTSMPTLEPAAGGDPPAVEAADGHHRLSEAVRHGISEVASRPVVGPAVGSVGVLLAASPADTADPVPTATDSGPGTGSAERVEATEASRSGEEDGDGEGAEQQTAGARRATVVTVAPKAAPGFEVPIEPARVIERGAGVSSAARLTPPPPLPEPEPPELPAAAIRTDHLEVELAEPDGPIKVAVTRSHDQVSVHVTAPAHIVSELKALEPDVGDALSREGFSMDSYEAAEDGRHPRPGEQAKAKDTSGSTVGRGAAAGSLLDRFV